MSNIQLPQFARLSSSILERAKRSTHHQLTVKTDGVQYPFRSLREIKVFT